MLHCCSCDWSIKDSERTKWKEWKCLRTLLKEWGCSIIAHPGHGKLFTRPKENCAWEWNILPHSNLRTLVKPPVLKAWLAGLFVVCKCTTTWKQNPYELKQYLHTIMIMINMMERENSAHPKSWTYGYRYRKDIGIPRHAFVSLTYSWQ